MKSIILKYSALLLPLEVLAWYISAFDPFGLSDRFPIPGIPLLSISGTILMANCITVFIFSQKEIIRKYPDIKLIRLGLSGALITLLSEFVFQTFKQFTYTDILEQRISVFLHGVIGVSLIAAGVSFLVAFQLKTKKTRLLIVFILTYCLICDVLLHVFPRL